MANEPVITVAGNLTRDPELRTVGSRQVADFSIASTPRTFNRQTNQWEDGEAMFLDCSAWGDLAQHVQQSLAKGMRVLVQGRLTQRSYQAKDGSTRRVFQLTVDEIGPSLRYATAQVQRQARQSGGFQPAAAQGGYTGGYSAPQQQQTAPATGSADSWAGSSNYGASNSFDSDFGSDDVAAF